MDISVHCDVNIFEWLVKVIDFHDDDELFVVVMVVVVVVLSVKPFSNRRRETTLNTLSLFFSHPFTLLHLSSSFFLFSPSSHCPLHQFIESPLTPPRLDTASVVSILISSEFLEMDRLVNHCLNFMAAVSCVPCVLLLLLAVFGGWGLGLALRVESCRREKSVRHERRIGLPTHRTPSSITITITQPQTLALRRDHQDAHRPQLLV